MKKKPISSPFTQNERRLIQDFRNLLRKKTPEGRSIPEMNRDQLIEMERIVARFLVWEKEMRRRERETRG